MVRIQAKRMSPVDWDEVARWAQLYSEHVLPKGEYWSDEAEVPAPWKEEKICEFCGKFFEACRPTQTVCSRACQSGRDMESWRNQATVWIAAYNSGLSLDRIAEASGASKGTVHRVMTYYGFEPRDKRAFLKFTGSDYD